MSSVNTAVKALLHTSLGTGLISIPFFYKNNGIILSVVLLAFSYLMSTTGLILQCQLSNWLPTLTLKKKLSFKSIGDLLFDEKSNKIVLFDIAIAIKCFGVSISYLIVIGDLMPQILRYFTSKIDIHRSIFISFSLFCIIMPLCFIKKISSLKKFSMIALISVVYLCFMIIINAFVYKENDQKGHIYWSKPKKSYKDINFLTSFPISVFAFTCQHNTFSIFNELKTPTFANFSKIVVKAMSCALIIYLTVGTPGYITFGDNVESNIIKMYEMDNFFNVLGRFCIVVLVTLAYPLQMYPCRLSIYNIYNHFQNKPIFNSLTDTDTNESITLLNEEELNLEQQINSSHLDIPDLQFKVITMSIIIAGFFIAISLTNLGLVLGFIGGTGSTLIAFILPGLFSYLLFSKIESDPAFIQNVLLKNTNIKDYKQEIAQIGSVKQWKLLSIGLIVYGVCIMIFANIGIIYKMLH